MIHPGGEVNGTAGLSSSENAGIDLSWAPAGTVKHSTANMHKPAHVSLISCLLLCSASTHVTRTPLRKDRPHLTAATQIWSPPTS